MADDSRLSAMIDDDGQLFGVINVIDALVALLLIAVLIAGLALVNPLSADGGETRYVTIDAGSQPSYIANQITEGDQWVPQGSGTALTVTDTFVSPRLDGDRNVIIRAAVEGPPLTTGAAESAANQSTTINFAGEPLRFGRVLTIETNQYIIEGTVTDVSRTETLGTPATQAVAVELSGISPERADRLAVGMTEIVAGQETATVTDISNQPTVETVSTGDGFETVERPQSREVTLTMTLNVREREDGTMLFRGKELQPDQTVVFELSGLTVEGQVTNIA